MSFLDRFAEQHAEWDGLGLVDYRQVGLPVLQIVLTVSVVNYSPLTPLKEYAIRCIHSGLSSLPGMSGLLGISVALAGRMVDEMVDEEFLYRALSGELTLTDRGEDVAKGLPIQTVIEEELSVLWDVIRNVIVLDRVELLSHSETASDSYVLLSPGRTRTPAPHEIKLTALETIRRQQLLDVRKEVFSINRVLQVGRGKLRYTPMIGLLYANEDRKEIRLRLANDDHADDGLTNAFAELEGLAKIGNLEGVRSKREEGILKQRLGATANSAGTDASSKLARTRAVKRFRLQGLQARFEEQPSPVIEASIAAMTAELRSLDEALRNSQAYKLLPFEPSARLGTLLAQAQRRVLVTTTLPHSAHFDHELHVALLAALERGIRVEIYVAGRIPANGQTDRALVDLQKLADRHATLTVGFLAEQDRRWFEILADENMLVVSNQPTLGIRKGANEFRAFCGVEINKKEDIAAYTATFLTESKLACVSRFVRNTSPAKRSTNNVRKTRTSNARRLP